METLLVLTDFSDAAFHAAEVACALAQQVKSKHIVLFHAYQTFVPATDVPVLPAQEQGLRENSLAALESVATRLQGKVAPDTAIITATADTQLTAAVNELATRESAGMVVMGVTGKSGLEKMLVGSNAIRMLEASEYPVLLVPPAAPVAPVENIIFATDLENVAGTLPLAQLESMLQAFPAKLWVLNVNKPGSSYDPNLKTSLMGLHQLLDKYNPEYVFTDNEDTVQGIADFAGSKKQALLLVVPRKRGLFASLFHRSIAKKLAYHTTVPLMALPQEG